MGLARPAGDGMTPVSNLSHLGLAVNAFGKQGAAPKARAPYPYSSEYLLYLASPAWAARRAAVLAAAGGKCEKCGAPAVEVHHTTYCRLGNE